MESRSALCCTIGFAPLQAISAASRNLQDCSCRHFTRVVCCYVNIVEPFSNERDREQLVNELIVECACRKYDVPKVLLCYTYSNFQY